MYEYKESLVNVRSLVAFALHRYKEQRGHRVPEPPSALYVCARTCPARVPVCSEELYETIKEGILELLVG
jgi:hypothetical protein